MESLVYWYALIVGDVLTPAIFVLFVLGGILLFKRHYLVESEHQFAISLQKGVTDYIQELYKQEQTREFSQIVWEILKQAHDHRRVHAEAVTQKAEPKKPEPAVKEAATEEGGSNPFIRAEARAEATMGADGKPAKFERPTFDLEDKTAKSEFGKKFNDYFDKRFEVEKGIEQIIDNTLEQTIHCDWNKPDPNFFNIASYAFNYNPYLRRIWTLTFDSVNSLLKSWSEILVMFGILGTFVGFFIALQSGEELKDGVSIAMVSSIVGMTLAVVFLILEKTFTDEETTMTSVEIYKDSLELIWVNCKEIQEGPKQESESVSRLKSITQGGKQASKTPPPLPSGNGNANPFAAKNNGAGDDSYHF